MKSVTTKCKYCDCAHGKRCPSVKAIEYHSNGKVKRVEFMTPQDYGNPAPGLFQYPAQPANPFHPHSNPQITD